MNSAKVSVVSNVGLILFFASIIVSILSYFYAFEQLRFPVVILLLGLALKMLFSLASDINQINQSQSLAVLRAVDSSTAKLIDEFIYNLLKIDSKPPQLLDVAKKSLNRAVELSSDCARGNVSVDADEWPVRIVLEQAEPEENIYVLSWVTAKWWQSNVGQEQVLATKTAINAGAHVTRIFIFHDGARVNDLKDIIDTMKKDKVKVFGVGIENILPEFQSPARGYIFGNKWTQETAYDSNYMPTKQSFSTRSSERVSAEKVFRMIHRLAKPL